MKIEIKIDGQEMMNANLEIDTDLLADASRIKIDAAREAFMAVAKGAYDNFVKFCEDGAETPKKEDDEA